MIKIYFNNKPVYLTDKINNEIAELLHHEETIFIETFNLHTVKTMIHEIQQSKINAGIFLHHDPEKVLMAFKKKLLLIKAAGGFVHTNKNELLLIFRNGKWDLPKGKLDDDEKIEDCALREIKEETGIEDIQMETFLCHTYHTYHQDGKFILKETHWFLIKAPKQTTFSPQLEEGIEKCEWVDIDKLNFYMENTYTSILDVVNAGVNALQETKNN